jgi:hypothetical protein
VHIPYDLTWQHEVVPDEDVRGKTFAQLQTIRELPDWLERTDPARAPRRRRRAPRG